MKARKQILLTVPRAAVPLARQTPGESRIWGDCEFHINTPLTHCDAWIVIEGLHGPQATRCPQENVVFVGEEHHEVKTYPQAFLDQFGLVRACAGSATGHRVDIGCLPLPWHVGIRRSNNQCTLTYDDFVNMQPPAKTRVMGTVCSNKKMTRGHIIRSAFVKAYKSRYADELDAYGELYGKADDKWQAIEPARFQLVIENGVHDHYWTEKLADAWLGWSYPIYWGCPNLESYFPSGSFARFDATDVNAGVAQVHQIIARGVSDAQRDAMHEARRLVLEKYNTFAILADIAAKLPGGQVKDVSLFPESRYVRLSAVQQVGRLAYFAKDSWREYFSGR